MAPLARSIRGARAGMIAIAALAAVAIAGSVADPRPASAAAPITEGRLLWGVKESWRKYIGTGTRVGEGAEITGWALDDKGDPLYPEGFSFPVVSGSFDPEANATRLSFGGYVHFQAYCAEKCLLDTKYSDLELEISREAQVLRGTHTGYRRDDPGGELHVDEDVVLAKYDIGGATTSFEAGQSKWTDVPTVAGPGHSIYVESTVLDPTSFEYAGPGGVPDLAEQWDTPGAPGLGPGAAWLADTASGARVLHASERDDVVHTVDLLAPRTVDAKLAISARDADSLEPVGSPFVWAFPAALKNDRQELRTAFDPETDSIFFVTYNEGAARNLATVRRAVWDAGAQTYAVEEVGSLGALTNSRRVTALAWNPVEDELAAIAYAGSTGDVYATDKLHRFRLADGSWEHDEALLRLPDQGEWAGATSVVSPFGQFSTSERDDEPLAVARDGSYVSAAGTGRTNPGSHYYPALHIVVAADGSAAVTPIEGTVPTSPGTYYGFSSLAADGDGSLLLHNSTQHMDAYARIDVVGGEAVRVGDTFDAPADAFPPYEVSGFANSIAADPARGITWATDAFTAEGYRLNALKDGEIVGRYPYAEFPEASAKGAFARLAVGPDGSVYLPTKDPASGRLGYRRLAFTGFVPRLTAQPQDEAVVLGPGQGSKTAGFSIATADPGAAIQWQSRSAGAAAFADVPGATGATLELDAGPVADGTEYRAKVSNGAGRIVSETAKLDVDYAPRIVSDLSSLGVSEGTDAVFVLSADADPEPQVSWQRRVDGYWQAIAADDDNFAINGFSLTVLDANVEQSGSLFRAKLTNPAGTVFSRQARLTVAPPVEVPDDGVDLDGVNLEWTGNAELQKAPPFGGSNYFSAGASEGDEATYSAASGDVRVLQVAADGAESPATWATRAAHVATGGSQLVRLGGGEGRIEADGSASVQWQGAFSVNFYGGLVPFALRDPALTVDAEGDGALTAELSGCASSQANPNECVPFPPRAGVTVATFSGLEVDPATDLLITPDYAGVMVSVPEGGPPQNRSVAGWGAWPQSFVDFHLETGLASYWYSSGGSFDPYKPPHPILVDFAGGAPPADPGTPQGDPEPPAPPPSSSSAAPAGKARVKLGKRVQRVGRSGTVRLAWLACPADGPCTVSAPRRLRLRIGERRYPAYVLAPRRVPAGAGALLGLRLSKPALAALGAAKVTLRVGVRTAEGELTTRTVRLRLTG